MTHPNTPVAAAPCPHPLGAEISTQQHFQPSSPNPTPVPHPKPHPQDGDWQEAAPRVVWNREFPVTTRGTAATSLLDTKNKQVCYAFFFFFLPRKVYFFKSYL